jgi:protoporphyrinogen oxidase
MTKFAVVGAGVSGLSFASMLNDAGFDVTVFEAANSIGGLVKCTTHEGVLFHNVGGHVFNAKNPRVFEWFWSKFDQELDFVKSKRRAKILLNEGLIIDYPIESSLDKLNENTIKSVVDDLLVISSFKDEEFQSFKDFLLRKFGKTLCDLYFFPYNKKIWNFPLEEIPLDWLDGKLPMPNVSDILIGNIKKVEEDNMVHSTFYYPRSGGSQFIVDRLARGLKINLSRKVEHILTSGEGVIIDGEIFDKVIYTGNLINLFDALEIDDPRFKNSVKNLNYNSTTNVL